MKIKKKQLIFFLGAQFLHWVSHLKHFYFSSPHLQTPRVYCPILIMFS